MKPSQPVKQPEPVSDDPFWGDITLNDTQQKVLHVIQQYVCPPQKVSACKLSSKIPERWE